LKREATEDRPEGLPLISARDYQKVSPTSFPILGIFFGMDKFSKILFKKLRRNEAHV
jgi:hypothetical protein